MQLQHQQHPFFPLLRPFPFSQDNSSKFAAFSFSPPSSTLTPTPTTTPSPSPFPPCPFSPFLMLSISLRFCSQMLSTSTLKASSTLLPFNADVSIYTTLLALEASRSSILCMVTSLFGRSDLLPTSRMTVSLCVFSKASSIHLLTLSKDLELVRSKTTIAPTAPLQQALVTARNRSCPAVSQIWQRMSLPLMWKDLEENSTPTVGFSSSMKTPSTKTETRLVLPTPASPMTTILKRQLYSYIIWNNKWEREERGRGSIWLLYNKQAFNYCCFSALPMLAPNQEEDKEPPSSQQHPPKKPSIRPQDHPTLPLLMPLESKSAPSGLQKGAALSKLRF